MRSKPKKRIDTNPTQAPMGAISPAFAKLDLQGLPEGRITPKAAQASPQTIWKMGPVVLRRETAHRGGKTVIVIHDFSTHLPASVIETIAKKVRAACGCGGTVKGRAIEIQGDQPARIRAVLEGEGFQVSGIK